MIEACDAYEDAMNDLARRCIGWPGHRTGTSCHACDAWMEWRDGDGAALQAAYDVHLATYGGPEAVAALEALEVAA